jgi:glycine/D-amino acid oxidase-like deaminating enzyme
VRTAPYRDGQRLLIVTGQHFTPGTADVTERFERLLVWAGDRLPEVEITHRWATQDITTTDRVPFVGPFHPAARHVHVPTARISGASCTSTTPSGHGSARAMVPGSTSTVR